MISKQQLFATILQGNGYSITKPRKQVFATLEKNKELTMNELVHILQSKCDRASVYRAVELFEELNIVSRISMGWKYKIELSDLFQGHHHHATCTNCERIIEFEETSDFASILEQLGAALDFQVSDHSLEVYGYCSRCQ